jgi:PAS domain S-box-containing protein
MANILVVDDEPASCELLVALFGYHGHRVLVAHNGAAGLALALAEPADLIITDILMPELDGYALATRVRADPALAHIQIIFYTAIDLGAEVRQLAAASGVAQIMTKPTEPAKILAIVHTVLTGAPPVALRTPASDLDHAYLRQLTGTLHRNVEALKAEIGAHAQAEALLRAQTARLTVLADASRAFAAIGQDFQAARHLIVRTIAEALGDTCTISLRPDADAGPPIVTLYDTDPAVFDRMRVTWQAVLLAASEDPSAQPVFADIKPLLISFVDSANAPSPAWPVQRQLLDQLRAHSLIIVPLREERRVIGQLYLTRHRREQPDYTPDDLQLAQDLADRAALAITNLRLLAQLQNELAERTRIEREMRRLNAELSRSQAQLAGIIDSAMDAIITIDDDQRISIWNAAAETMFGCSAGDARGQLLDRFIPARHREAHRDHICAFGRIGAAARAMGALRPITALRADGTEIPIEASISHVELDGRQLYTVILRDITARVQAETALRTSEERFAKAFQIGPVAMMISAGCEKALPVSSSKLSPVSIWPISSCSSRAR